MRKADEDVRLIYTGMAASESVSLAGAILHHRNFAARFFPGQHYAQRSAALRLSVNQFYDKIMEMSLNEWASVMTVCGSSVQYAINVCIVYNMY